MSTDHIPTLTINDLDYITSSMTTDTITWSDPSYVAVPNVTIDNSGLYSTITSAPTTFGPNVSGVNTMLGGTGYSYSGNGYTYTSGNTSPWVTTSNGATVQVDQSGTLELRGENADIKVNDKSMNKWMEAVEERLNILTPNPELEKDWDDLRRLGQRYRALERKCREKAQMWAALKKVQPKQP